MFRVFVRKRKRRLSTPRTVILSAGVHLLLLGAVVAVSTAAPAPDVPEETLKGEWDIVEPKAPPPPPEPEEPRPVDAPPPPTPGETVQLPAPTTIPDGIPKPDPHAVPLSEADVSGLGKVGDVIGPPPATPAPPTGNPAADPGPPSFDGYVYETVEEKPELQNGRDIARLLDRNYPRSLAEAGVAGQVMLELIVDVNGRVRPGSVRVVSATDPQFSDASVRVAERLRFTPARVGDRAVPVMVTLPIDWKPEDK
jgi:protein TonB